MIKIPKMSHWYSTAPELPSTRAYINYIKFVSESGMNAAVEKNIVGRERNSGTSHTNNYVI